MVFISVTNFMYTANNFIINIDSKTLVYRSYFIFKSIIRYFFFYANSELMPVHRGINARRVYTKNSILDIINHINKLFNKYFAIRSISICLFNFFYYHCCETDNSK